MDATITKADDIGLTRKVADELEPIAADIRKSGASAVENMIRIGGLLIQARGKLAKNKSGTFGLWIESRCGMGQTTARKMMRVVEVIQPYSTPGVEYIEATALYSLSAKSCPEPARDEALAIAKAGDHVSAKLARQLIEKHKPDDRTPEQPEQPIDYAAAVTRFENGLMTFLDKLASDGDRAKLLEHIEKHARSLRAEKD
jgi:hypothetical protein